MFLRIRMEELAQGRGRLQESLRSRVKRGCSHGVQVRSGLLVTSVRNVLFRAPWVLALWTKDCGLR